MSAGLVLLEAPGQSVACLFPYLEAANIPWLLAASLQSVSICHIAFSTVVKYPSASFFKGQLWLHLVLTR